jgi:hypothetical protein
VRDRLTGLIGDLAHEHRRQDAVGQADRGRPGDERFDLVDEGVHVATNWR